MRRLIIFIIVFIIAILIAYGIYKWGTSGEKQIASVKNQTEVSQPHSAVTEQKGSGLTAEPAQQVRPSLPVKPPEQPCFLSFSYNKALKGDIPGILLSKSAKTGILVNMETGEVLWDKDAQKAVPIASMTKMMTLLVIMEKMKEDPSITLDTEIQVTREASKVGGSQAWLDPREKFTINDLLKTVVIHSANDSAYLLAQYFGGGDVNNFIEMMNKKAKEMNMNGARFSNPDGLPEKNPADENIASAQDMAALAYQLMKYPLIVELAKTKSMTFRPDAEKPHTFLNTNRLVRLGVKGVTGLKTGYTARAGFCTTVTCERDNEKLVAVVTGFKTSKERDAFVRQLLDWGYNPNRLTQANTAQSSAAASGMTSGTSQVYTVQKGDSLWSIARKNNMTVSDLAKINNIDPQSPIRIGQKLKVSGTN